MKRRSVIKSVSSGAIAATGVAIVGGCQNSQKPSSTQKTDLANLPNIQWQMATSWPPSLDTIFGGATVLVDRVAALTGGKFKITP
ncbi:MAG: ABC transporter substrate-binding protein, partial [Xenococcaceae cyanobacterium]